MRDYGDDPGCTNDRVVVNSHQESGAIAEVIYCQSVRSVNKDAPLFVQKTFAYECDCERGDTNRHACAECPCLIPDWFALSVWDVPEERVARLLRRTRTMRPWRGTSARKRHERYDLDGASLDDTKG